MRTRTTTRTTTCTRAELLHLHVRLAIRRLALNPERILRRVLEPGLAKQLLDGLIFFGLDGQGLCHARLCLVVDWDEHDRLNLVEGQLSLPGREDATAPELGEMMQTFESIVECRRLRISTCFRLRDGVDVEQTRKLLGLTASRPITWAGTRTHAGAEVKRLPELTLRLDLADVEE